MNANSIEQVALALPIHQRTRLVELLLHSLSTQPEAEAQILWLDVEEYGAHEVDEEELWLTAPNELERRFQSRPA